MSSAEALPDRAVVVGIDGSGPAHNALMWAAREAAERQLPLVVCHAYQSAPAEPDWEVDNARRNRARRQVMDDVRTAALAVPRVQAFPRVAPGPITNALVNAVSDPELFVLGCHRRSRGQDQIADLLLDSFEQAGPARPLVMVQQQPRRPHRRSFVVLALDSADTAEVAAPFALTTAAVHRTRVVVMPVSRVGSRTVDDALDTLERLAKAYPDVSVEVLDDIPVGGPVAQMMRTSEHAELLVGPAGTGQLLGSSLARLAICRARCPVALIPRRRTRSVGPRACPETSGMVMAGVS